jgi:hypothetical protein
VTGAGVVGEEAVEELPGGRAFRGHKVTPWLRAPHLSWRRHGSCQAMSFAWITKTKRTSTGLESMLSGKVEELGLGHFKYLTKCSEIKSTCYYGTIDAPSPFKQDLV